MWPGTRVEASSLLRPLHGFRGQDSENHVCTASANGQRSHHTGPPTLFTQSEGYVALPGPGPTEILCRWSATIKDVCHHVPGHLYLFIFSTSSLPEPATHLHGQASQWVSEICPSLSPSVGVTDLCCCARPCGGPGAPHTHEVGSLPAEPSPQASQRPLLACQIITQSQGHREGRGT